MADNNKPVIPEMYNQDGVLNKVFEIVGQRAAFFSKLIKSTKIVPHYNELRSKFLNQNRDHIADYITQRINSFKRLAGERVIKPHNILAAIGAIDAARQFKPIISVVRAPNTNNLEFIKFILNADLQNIDPKNIVAIGIPLMFLHKLVKQLEKIEDPVERMRLFKLALSNGAANMNPQGIKQEEPLPVPGSGKLYNF